MWACEARGGLGAWPPGKNVKMDSLRHILVPAQPDGKIVHQNPLLRSYMYIGQPRSGQRCLIVELVMSCLPD